MTRIIYPAYYRLIRREGCNWEFRRGNLFYSPHGHLLVEQRESAYQLTREQIEVELFRINGGKSGYYLVNLRDKLYYYCGNRLSDVQEILIRLGIGRPEPPGG